MKEIVRSFSNLQNNTNRIYIEFILFSQAMHANYEVKRKLWRKMYIKKSISAA
jgi:uncharacterized protein YfbU (UPF0304 family)